jgi:hypothetical protein
MKIFEKAQLSVRSNYYHYSKDIINNKAKIKSKYLNSTVGIEAFWWSDILNFGDLFTPDIIKAFGYEPIRVLASNAKVAGVGSIIGAIPDNYSGVILGSGIISPNSPKRLPDAKFAAVRGELTKKVMGLNPNTPTGDFGLLAPKLYKQQTKKYVIGLVPHYVDRFNPWIYATKEKYGSQCCIIDVQDSAKSVSEKISECEIIVSSSMHGIIVADSFNIPNVWIQLSDKVIGNGFKFHDYNTAIDYEQECFFINSLDAKLNLEKIAKNKNFDVIRNKINNLWHITDQVLEDVKKFDE